MAKLVFSEGSNVFIEPRELKQRLSLLLNEENVELIRLIVEGILDELEDL